MKVSRDIVLFFFFYLLTQTCLAQDYITNIQYYTKTDGLSGSSVHCVNQDDNGVIWVGTYNGLNYFDGTTFRLVNDRCRLLQNGLISGIKKKEGTPFFWIQRLNLPVLLFDPINQEILPFPDDTAKRFGQLQILNPYGNGSELILYNGDRDLFYVGADDKIMPFSVSVEQFEIHTGSSKSLFIKKTGIDSIFEFSTNGEVINRFYSLARNSSVYRPNGSQTFAVIENKGAKLFSEVLFEQYEGQPITPIYLYKDGAPLKTEEIINHKGSSFSALQLDKDSKKNIWISSANLLLFFDNKGELRLDLSEEISAISNDGNYIINQVFIDADDRVWLAEGSGLYQLTVKPNPFSVYLPNDQVSMRGIREINDSLLLIGSYRGSKVVHKHSKKVLFHTDNHFIGISQKVDNVFWAALHGGHIIKFDEKSWDLDTININEPIPHAMNNIYFDSITNKFIAGGSDPLIVLEKDGQFQKFNKYNEFEHFKDRTYSHMTRYEDAIWIASNNGLYELDLESGIKGHYTFPHNVIKHFYIDTEGIFWIATGGGGLVRWNQKNNEIKTFDKKNGLYNDFIYAVYEDGNGYLWLPSDEGLMCFHKTTGEVQVLLPEDGIPHEEFNSYAHCKGTDGYLYFGGLNGFVRFHPDSLEISENLSPLQVLNIDVFDESENDLVNQFESFRKEKSIVLRPGDKFFTLDFALLDYGDRDHLYAWKLEGLDKDWTYQNESTIRINQLDYGNYTLKIKAKGTGGNWAKSELSIPVKVLKPFYLHPVFIVLSCFVLGALIYAFFRYQLRSVERSRAKLKALVGERTSELSEKNEALEEANQFKNKILSVIAHDLRAPLLTLNDLSSKINYLIEKGRVEDIARLSESINKSSKNVHILLDNLFNWALVQKGDYDNIPKEINIKQTIDQVIQLYQSTADAKSIKLEGLGDDDLKAYADSNAVSTIFRNLINNAIKFTNEGGRIFVDAKRRNGFVEVKVQDTGVGIAKEDLPYLFDLYQFTGKNGTRGEMGKGFGLKLCKELVTLNQGKLQVSAEIGKGTSFLVSLPSFTNES